MAGYFGNIGERVTVSATLKNVYTFNTCFGYRTQENNIYTMEGESGNIFVWKTTSVLGIESVDSRDNYIFEGVHRGDCFTFKATIKEHSDYKGIPQTVLTRLKVIKITKKAATKEERDAAKAKEQRESMNNGDFLWTMPYKQFKEHYSDCETLAGSFRASDNSPAEITVIIRSGRLVPSGVRGLHYSGFQFQNEKGEKVTYRAISEETARRRLSKDFGSNEQWECVKIFHY